LINLLDILQPSKSNLDIIKQASHIEIRLVTLVLFFLLAFARGTPTLAQADDALNPDPVILPDEQDEFSIGSHMEILEDPSRGLANQYVTAPEIAARFIPSLD
jgi:hypothetical protein